jgi:hypothetical protein
MMVMPMWWDYVSELRPPTSLLFISRVIHEYEETWWNDVDRGKLIRPLELSGKPTNSHLVAKQEEPAKGMMHLSY